MARVLESLNGRSDQGDFGHLSDYPWRDWADGRPWEIRNQDADGEDFGVSVRTMRVYLYQWMELVNTGQAPQPVTHEFPTAEQIRQGRVPQWKCSTRLPAPGVVRFQFVRDPDDGITDN